MDRDIVTLQTPGPRVAPIRMNPGDRGSRVRHASLSRQPLFGQGPHIGGDRPAYRLGLAVAGIIFLGGGIADMVWRVVLGMEADPGVLFSPTRRILRR